MKTVEEWRQCLRGALKAAMKARQTDSVAVLREAIAALDNAEAADLAQAPAVQQGVIAGGVEGLGAGEVSRKALSPADAAELIAREVAERRAAAVTLSGLGKQTEADRLTAQADLLESLR